MTQTIDALRKAQALQQSDVAIFSPAFAQAMGSR